MKVSWSVTLTKPHTELTVVTLRLGEIDTGSIYPIPRGVLAHEIDTREISCAPHDHTAISGCSPSASPSLWTLQDLSLIHI